MQQQKEIQDQLTAFESAYAGVPYWDLYHHIQAKCDWDRDWSGYENWPEFQAIKAASGGDVRQFLAAMESEHFRQEFSRRA